MFVLEQLRRSISRSSPIGEEAWGKSTHYTSGYNPRG
jgi:hypothetical protein